MPSVIASTFSGVERARSVSSIRRTNLPPQWRAYSQQKSAVRTLPRCRTPIGLGANRVRTVTEVYGSCGEGAQSIKVNRTLGHVSHLATRDLTRVCLIADNAILVLCQMLKQTS